MKELVSADIYMLYIYKYIYIERERERETHKSVSLQRCTAFFVAALLCCQNIPILLQRCYFKCMWQLSMPFKKMPLLPNSCSPMADGPFRDPKGRSYPNPKYWTQRWRIDINISHGISPIEPSYENQGTRHIIRRHYYQIDAAQWQMVHFGTSRVSHIYK